MQSGKKDQIIIKGARENNLRNINVSIPKKKITVLTGVSGSGKSSLVFDTIAAEAQRQLNETFSSFIRHRLPHYGQPDADLMQNLSPAIIVDQKQIRGNARSTVGTITDIYSLLRLLYSRIGKPFIGYSNIFSFNHPEGMCPVCDGLGTVTAVDIKKLFDRSKSLNEGAILFPAFAPGSALWKRFVLSGYFDNDKKLKDYTEEEWQLLLYQEEIKPKSPKAGWWPSAKYEGVITRFNKRFLDTDPEDSKKSLQPAMRQVVTKGPCPACKGARLNEKVLSCKIHGKNIAENAALQVSDLIKEIGRIKEAAAQTMVAAIIERLTHLEGIGLGYLSLNRETSTLSGGESQRVKMVRHLGSSLCDMMYIFDEPSTGLHARDVHQLNVLMQSLRDKGNTVLIVEHDPDVITIADHIIDMGPGAGKHGGEIVYEGTVKGLMKSGTLTGIGLRRQPALRETLRKPAGSLKVRNATLHNLQKVSVDIPEGVFTVVTGVAGSGKSSLINGVLPRLYPDIVCINQHALAGSVRSNPATYTGIADQIRSLFARANKVSAGLFTSNGEGACPACKGLGVTSMDLAFMDAVVTTCEVCQGRRFKDNVLGYTLRGKSIDEVLKLNVEEASQFFSEEDIVNVLQRLHEVGLDYLTLGQPLDSLSGGERQRIKLATELENTGNVYILDEPTTGLHLSDVDNLIALLNRLVDNGSTVIAIEHNLDVISQADWIIDMGPGAGRDGGKVVFEGTPAALINDKNSLTGIFLKKYIHAR
ncbi:ATP-binding cassette domain-containing protein [Chitinophaga arvensicola]|uniref:UvrABC system protein A n=1 Tax=Chitinophaga arvensicola TaxID=29529 RepID=A0A1I0S6T3_9BACT|nr:excinuclease ABC subunit UvrA [Chitinophaga arvensicola]SEW51313.1 excinuclease ABC, A subunit [Chitinophaga arvensicola]